MDRWFQSYETAFESDGGLLLHVFSLLICIFSVSTEAKKHLKRKENCVLALSYKGTEVCGFDVD